MKTVQIDKFGDPADVLKLTDVAEPPAPGAGEVAVQVAYSPVNLHDLAFISGQLGQPRLPLVPGNEGIAHVVSVGRQVDNVSVGGLVVLPLLAGAWRERLVIPSPGLFALPDADILQLSMLGSNTPAAGLILSEYADLKEGDWVVQDAANGGVGRNIIALAKNRGFKTINFVRRESAISEVRAAGGDIALIDRPGAVDEIRGQIGDGRVLVAADSVGGSVASTMLELLAPGGTLVSYGNASGEPVHQDSPAVKEKKLTVAGLFVPAFDNLHKIVPVIREAAPLVARGTLAAPVEAVYPLDDVLKAVAHAQRGGKILLRVDPSA